MATVIFPGELQQFTGEAQTQVAASRYSDMVLELEARYPQLVPGTLAKMAVAIDDVIVAQPMLEPLYPDTEVFFLHFVAGG